MTVLLAGVGADGINTNPIPPIFEDGRFEYIPIPETELGTAETRTYGSERLRYQDQSMAEYVNWIKPGGDDDRRKDSLEEIKDHPLHYDPDFANLTYGESSGRSDYVDKLMKLQDGDILAFYAGLSDGSRIHRYLIGCFTVNEVVNTGGKTGEERRSLLEDHEHNAHAKRYLGTGESKFDEVAIVDGKDPGGLLQRSAIKMSVYKQFEGNKIKQYYLADDFAREFTVDDPTWNHDPESDHKDDKIYLGVKPALRLAMTADEFIDKLGASGPL